MIRRCIVLFACYFGLAIVAQAEQTYPIANQVRNIIEAPADRIDYATAKLMFDKLIDPSVTWKLPELRLARWSMSSRE